MQTLISADNHLLLWAFVMLAAAAAIFMLQYLMLYGLILYRSLFRCYCSN